MLKLSLLDIPKLSDLEQDGIFYVGYEKYINHPPDRGYGNVINLATGSSTSIALDRPVVPYNRAVPLTSIKSRGLFFFHDEVYSVLSTRVIEDGRNKVCELYNMRRSSFESLWPYMKDAMVLPLEGTLFVCQGE